VICCAWWDTGTGRGFPGPAFSYCICKLPPIWRDFSFLPFALVIIPLMAPSNFDSCVFFPFEFFELVICFCYILVNFSSTFFFCYSHDLFLNRYALPLSSFIMVVPPPPLPASAAINNATIQNPITQTHQLVYHGLVFTLMSMLTSCFSCANTQLKKTIDEII